MHKSTKLRFICQNGGVWILSRVRIPLENDNLFMENTKSEIKLFRHTKLPPWISNLIPRMIMGEYELSDDSLGDPLGRAVGWILTNTKGNTNSSPKRLEMILSLHICCSAWTNQYWALRANRSYWGLICPGLCWNWGKFPSDQRWEGRDWVNKWCKWWADYHWLQISNRGQTQVTAHRKLYPLLFWPLYVNLNIFRKWVAGDST